jgi:hypothetical protein
MAQTDLDLESLHTDHTNHSNDDELVERVRTRLAVILADLAFEVKAKAGVVTLTGQIRDSAQSRAASLVTHRVEGVTNVVNKLAVGNGLASFALNRGVVSSRPKAAASRRSRRVGTVAADERSTGEESPRPAA